MCVCLCFKGRLGPGVCVFALRDVWASTMSQRERKRSDPLSDSNPVVQVCLTAYILISCYILSIISRYVGKILNTHEDICIHNTDPTNTNTHKHTHTHTHTQML